jgi:hypothetical protein
VPKRMAKGNALEDLDALFRLGIIFGVDIIL